MDMQVLCLTDGKGLQTSRFWITFDRLQNQAHEAESHHSEIMLYLAKLDGREEAYKRIISLLETV